MFPSNLHKNILQLDKQISLLENECKNMEVDKRKKVMKSEKSQAKCAKASNSQLKTLPPKVPLKKSACNPSKKTTKTTPPFSARVRSSSSVQSTYSKPWSEIGDTLPNRKIKQRSINTKPHSYLSTRNHSADFQSQTKNEEPTKCVNGKNELSTIISEKEKTFESEIGCGDNKKDQILHKEVIFSNSGERIEVIVTQKPNSDDAKENLLLRKKNNLRNLFNKDVSNCNCHLRGQKWSDILALDSVRRKEAATNNSASPSSAEKTQIYQPFCCAISKVLHEKISAGDFSKNGKLFNDENNEIETLLKLVQPTHKVVKPTVHVTKPEKETQCYLDQSPKPLTNADAGKMFPLFSELDQKSNEEKKKFPANMEFIFEKLSYKDPEYLYKKLIEENKNEKKIESAKNDYQYILKQQSDNFAKERETLYKELTAKEKVIIEMQKREEEYKSVISNLKLSLEKSKDSAQQGINTNKELNYLKQKFLEQGKISSALKKSHSRLQKVLERCALENDKLKTQVQIYKLESQKHDVLLAGKEAEIKRYKDEIGNFHKQISEHLASLKTNAQAIDVEKMMETIMQQTEIFVQKDVDSTVFDLDKDSKQMNGLMHSSPTSTKTSVVNSSWKRISSIRDHDHSVGKPETDNFNESHEKEFYQIFGETTPESKESRQFKKQLLEKLFENENKKKDYSFTSCLSIQEDDDCGYSSTSKNDVIRDKPSLESPKKIYPSEKVQSNIEELLENMKLKWSKEIRGNSSENYTIDEFLNNSQISSISLMSGNPPYVESPK